LFIKKIVKIPIDKYNELIATDKKSINKIINKGTVNNNTQNINKGNVNNIVVNNFCYENVDYLKKEFIYNAIKTPNITLDKLTQATYFNKKHPENHNIKKTNIRDGYVEILKNSEWTLDKTDNVLWFIASYMFGICLDTMNENKDVTYLTEKYFEKIKKRYYAKDKSIPEQVFFGIINGTRKIHKQ